MSDIDIHQILGESVPMWQRAEFLFLEPHPWWAPSVQAQLAGLGVSAASAGSGAALARAEEPTDYRCHSVGTTRAIHDGVQTQHVTGMVLFVGGQMRDCLLLLGRLSRLCRPSPPVLMVVPPNLVSLLPLLMESGAAAVMLEGATDVQIADWCRRAAESTLS